MSRSGVSKAVGPVLSLVIPIQPGALATFAASTRKFTAAQDMQIIGASLNVGLRGGTHATSTVDLQDDGVSVLGAAFDVAALTPGTQVEKVGASLAAGAATVAKDSVMSIVVAVSGGTSPTWGDADIQIDYLPKGN